MRFTTMLAVGLMVLPAWPPITFAQDAGPDAPAVAELAAPRAPSDPISDAATPAPATTATLLQGPMPDWAEDLPIPVATAEQELVATDGKLYLLTDQQIRWQGDQRETFLHYALKVTSSAGLEDAAGLLRNFDPEFEAVTLTRLTVTRNGVTTDYLHRLIPTVYRRETGLEQGMIDGTLTAHIELPDVRVGDIVEVASVEKQRPRIDGETASGSLQIGYSVPVLRSRVVLIWPKDWPDDFEVFGLDEMTATVVPGTETTAYAWERGYHPAAQEEDKVPDWVPIRAFVRYSRYTDWAPIEATLHDAYSKAEALPPEWELKLDAIRASSNKVDDQVIAALRLVQNDIRYVGIEVGVGGFHARPPELVAARGFGDCKDKALLLKTLLGRLGVKADVALADSSDGPGIDRHLPGVDLFNHMIVGAMIRGHRIWMDPTARFEGGTLAHAAPPDLGYVLPIGDDAPGRLEHIDSPPAKGRLVSVDEHHAFSPDGDRIDLSLTYDGRSADRIRDRLATDGLRQWGEDTLRGYASTYPGITPVGTPEVSDNMDQNRIVLKARFLLPQQAIEDNDLLSDFPFNGPGVGSDYPKAQVGHRRADMVVPYYRRVTERLTVENAPINFRAPEASVLSNAAFDYAFFGVTPKRGNLMLNWTYSTKAKQIAAKDVAQVIRDARKLRSDDYLTWDLSILPPKGDSSN